MTGEQLRQYLTTVSALADEAIALGHAQNLLRDTQHLEVRNIGNNTIVTKVLQDSVSQRMDQLRCDALEDVQDSLRVKLQHLVKAALAINEHIGGIRTIEIK